MAAIDADLASDYQQTDIVLQQSAAATMEILPVPVFTSQVDDTTVSIVMVDLGVSSKNLTPPVIANVDPPTGTQLSSRSAPISFDVTDLDPGVQVVILTVKYSNRVETQVVYNGSDFITPFNSAGSQVLAIVNGYNFTVAPENQWLGDIDEFFVYAIDIDGNVEGLP